MLTAIGRLGAVIALCVVPCAASAQPCDKAAECQQDARESDHISLELRLRWRPIGAVLLDSAGRLQFPEVDASPGIYRFELRSTDDRALYIGETDNLRRRFSQYRAPGPRQPTNHRICMQMRQALAAGGSVAVSIGEQARLCAQTGCESADLASANHRRLLEQLAIFAVPRGVRALNSERIAPPGGRSKGEKFAFCS